MSCSAAELCKCPLTHNTFRRLFATTLDEEAFEQISREFTAVQRGEQRVSNLLAIDARKNAEQSHLAKRKGK